MSLVFNEWTKWHIVYPYFIVFFSREDWLSRHLHVNNRGSPTTLEAPTTTTRLRNISSTRINYPHHMFIPHLTHWTQQHLIIDQPPLYLTISSWLRTHLPINECGVLELQIRWDLIPMIDIHSLYKVYGLFDFNNLLFAQLIHGWCTPYQLFFVRFSLWGSQPFLKDLRVC
jgi:hypothetical protein